MPSTNAHGVPTNVATPTTTSPLVSASGVASSASAPNPNMWWQPYEANPKNLLPVSVPLGYDLPYPSNTAHRTRGVRFLHHPLFTENFVSLTSLKLREFSIRDCGKPSKEKYKNQEVYPNSYSISFYHKFVFTSKTLCVDLDKSHKSAESA